MRGYFGIGAERISKQLNLGNLMRSAHGFGASFFFTVGSDLADDERYADTSHSIDHVPLYQWDDPSALQLPDDCRLVGVELLDDAVELPSFRHPLRAAYVLGPEAGSLSPQMIARCDHVVKIPTAFCVNLAMAGAIVMYDRVLTLGRHAPRPVVSGGPLEMLAAHVHGGVKSRRKVGGPGGVGGAGGA